MRLKINLAQITKIQFPLLLLIITVILANSFIFLYNNFYKTLTRSQEIIRIKDEVILETINLELFNQVAQNLTHKKTDPEIDWTSFKNPFLPYASESNQE